MKIVFIDPKCPFPYDCDVLNSRGLGGTEATVTRIAKALAEEHDVCVVQHNRTSALQEGRRLLFAPGTAADAAVEGADHVIFIQKAQSITSIARRTTGRLWLWLHNYLGSEVPFFHLDHLRHRLGIVCVSKTHAQHTRRHVRRHPFFWLSAGLLNRAGIAYLYNPIDDSLGPQAAIVKKRHQLIFFSSPSKGIEQVIAAFNQLHARNPAFRLLVADPGYFRNFDRSQLDQPNITLIGSLSHREVMQRVQESLCVFYPQCKRPETFGLVYAEANAVGVPVLAHDFGAAREVLHDNNPPIDARDSQTVSTTVLQWATQGPPQVAASPRFGLRHVASMWADFLNAPDAFMRKQSGELAALS